jgi:hypothetical protein
MTQAVKLAGTAAHLQGAYMDNISLKGSMLALDLIMI